MSERSVHSLGLGISSTTATSAASERTRLPVRGVILGLLLSVLLCALTPYSDYALSNTYIAGNHFPVGAVTALLLLALAGRLSRRVRGRPLLGSRDLAVTYILVMVTSGIPSSGVLRYLLPVISGAPYYAVSNPQWPGLFFQNVPPWMAVMGDTAVRGFWEGLSPGQHIPWMDWWLPLSRWTIFIAALWGTMICLAALVRKQWVERERLTFPLVQFPLEVVKDTEVGGASSFFANRLVWIGAASIFLLHLSHGLSRLFPAIPVIPTFFSLDAALTDRPWDALIPLWLRIYPSVIGFGYLLSLEVAAGFWISVWLVKLQALVMTIIGYEGNFETGIIGAVCQQEQMGAVLAIAAILLYSLRGTFKDAFRRLFTRSCLDDSREAVSYRLAAFGLVLSLGIAQVWLMVAGLRWPFALADLLVFVCLSLVLTRIVAEAGLLMVHYSFRPMNYLLLLGGVPALGPQALTTVTYVDMSLMWDMRELLMPSVLNGYRLAEQSGVSKRKLTPLICGALLLCLAATTPVFLATFYKLGAGQVSNAEELTAAPRWGFSVLASSLETHQVPGMTEYGSMLAGAAIVALLARLRLSLVWWPIHPLGFVMATSWASTLMWFSLFLGWLCKLLSIRYGGLKGYLQVRPFFLGMIMGDVLSAAFWIVVSFFTGHGIMVTVS